MMFRSATVKPYLTYQNLKFASDHTLWLDFMFPPDGSPALNFAILPVRLVNYLLHDDMMSNRKSATDLSIINEKRRTIIESYFSPINYDNLLNEKTIEEITCFMLNQKDCVKYTIYSSKFFQRVLDHYLPLIAQEQREEFKMVVSFWKFKAEK
mgnify:CR=1 FL=1